MRLYTSSSSRTDDPDWNVVADIEKESIHVHAGDVYISYDISAANLMIGALQAAVDRINAAHSQV